MFEYLLINTILAAILAGLLLVLWNVPARLKLALSGLAIVVWLVPWSQLDIRFVQPIAEPFYQIKIQKLKDVEDLFGNDAESIYEQARLAGGAVAPIPLSDGSTEASAGVQAWRGFDWRAATAGFFLLSLIVGGLKFCWAIYDYRRKRAQWFSQSYEDPCLYALRLPCDIPPHVRIRRLKGDVPGMATGLIHPTVWINDRITDELNLKSVLLHELTHIRHHDVWISWGVCLTKSLFWWNPIVLAFCRRARSYMEFSCDEACVKLMRVEDYACSLAEIALNTRDFQTRAALLGVQRSSNENVLRLESLRIVKQINPKHIAMIAGALLFASVVSLVVAYDKAYFKLNASMIEERASDVVGDTYQTRESDRHFSKLSRLISEGRYVEAEVFADDLESEMQARGELNELAVETIFRLRASIYGDTDRYALILEQHKALFPVIYAYERKVHNRILSIAHIRLGQFNEALDLLERGVYEHHHYGPSEVLLAQVYYLTGRYQDAIKIARVAVKNSREATVFEFVRPLMYQVIGKSALAMNDLDLASEHATKLGLSSVSELEHVRLDQQKLPHMYFRNSFIAGVDVANIDQQKYPLPDQLPASSDPTVQLVLNNAANAFYASAFLEAQSILARGYRQLSAKVKPSERVKVLEFMFVLNMVAGDSATLLNTSKELIRYEEGSELIKLRAYYVLSVGDTKKDVGSRIGYFEKYLSLQPEQNLATDHEIIDRYYWVPNHERMKPALYRVNEFYESNGYIPDVMTVNRMIGLFEQIEDFERANYYREVLETHYPRAYNFVLG